MNVLSRWLCLLLLLPSANAWSKDAHRIDIMFDTSGSMRGARQSLISTVQTLAWSLVLAAEQDEISGVTLSLSGFCENAEQIQVAGRDVFDVTQWTDAARALDELGRGCKGDEDGLNALDATLRARPAGRPGHLLLITDEPRSVVHKDINVIELLRSLYDRRLVLDAMLNVQVRCGDGRRALGLTQGAIGYVATDSGRFDQCTGARIAHTPSSVVSDYASMAIASGGSIWDVSVLGYVHQRRDDGPSMIDVMAQSYTSNVLNRARWQSAASDFMARPLASTTRVMVGEALLLDGQSSVGARSDLGVLDWHWDVDGDGSIDHFGPNASHTFHAAGVFPLTLNVVDSDGNRDSQTLWIDVHQP